MLTRKSLLIATAGSLIIGFVGGLNVASLFSFGGGLSKAQTEKIRMFFPSVSEVKDFSGTVKRVSGQTITLEISESPNPFDEWPTGRKVTVADTTKIIRTSQKDPIAFKKEMDTYFVAVSNAGGPTKLPSVSPPVSVNEEVISLSDLKVGDVITVEADHNIKNETQFTAIKITVAR